MMLQHLGHRAAHDDIISAIENVLREGTHLTPDMGGRAKTIALAKAIEAAI
jgi:tartrate dehydrogenase/decarboxylase/D-malate dehydrogenase